MYHYEVELPFGVKESAVKRLNADVARCLGVPMVTVSRKPGTDTLLISVPRTDRETVKFLDILDSLYEFEGEIPLVLGRDLLGKEIIEDLTRMPHLLIAGSTGSGKSSLMQGIIQGIMIHMKSSNCRLTLIDPKQVEFNQWDDMPHLSCPVITDSHQAIAELEEMCDVMDARYKAFADIGVKDIISYNEYVVDTLPYVVCIIDEYADLVGTDKQVNTFVQRLAQKGRAAGIHLILATQRPSVDVISGVIKANFTSRICFRVSSAIDSRTMGVQGAHELMGAGDMIFSSKETVRIQGSFTDDEDVQKIIEMIEQNENYVPFFL
jgi:S-DNA-T family DNA segregation ATPase FtsK/SpoIIIE